MTLACYGALEIVGVIIIIINYHRHAIDITKIAFSASRYQQNTVWSIYSHVVDI